jgi:hypothetical protein
MSTVTPIPTRLALQSRALELLEEAQQLIEQCYEPGGSHQGGLRRRTRRAARGRP